MAGINIKSLPTTFKYCCHILYHDDHQGHQISTSERDEVNDAEEKAMFISNKLDQFGYPPNYLALRDAICGKSIFEELFDAIENSLFILVILTPGFLRNDWDLYCQNSAFYEFLKDGQSYRLLPIAIGLKKDEVPKSLNIKRVLFVDEDGWRSNDAAWLKLDRALTSGLDTYNSSSSATDCLSIGHITPQENIVGFPEMLTKDDEMPSSVTDQNLDFSITQQEDTSATYLKELNVSVNSDNGFGSMNRLSSLVSSSFNRLVSFLTTDSNGDDTKRRELPPSDQSYGVSSLVVNSFKMTCHMLSKPDQPYFS